MPIDALVSFIMATVVLSLAPGPDNIFVLAQSALYAKKTGVLVTLGLSTGLLVHTTAVALGVAVVFQTSVLAFTLLQVVGAIYLLYLAWQAFRAAASAIDTPALRARSNWALYRRGIIMNITNPKVSIFFLAFLPQFALPAQGALAPQIFMLGGVFLGVSLLIFCAIAVLAGTLGCWLNQSPQAQIYLNRVAGVVFVGLAVTATADVSPAL